MNTATRRPKCRIEKDRFLPPGHRPWMVVRANGDTVSFETFEEACRLVRIASKVLAR